MIKSIAHDQSQKNFDIFADILDFGFPIIGARIQKAVHQCVVHQIFQLIQNRQSKACPGPRSGI